MHSIQLKIDDSIFDKVMTMLELLPQDKIKVEDKGYDYPTITNDEAKKKVEKAINNIANDSGLDFEKVFDKVLRS